MNFNFQFFGDSCAVCVRVCLFDEMCVPCVNIYEIIRCDTSVMAAIWFLSQNERMMIQYLYLKWVLCADERWMLSFWFADEQVTWTIWGCFGRSCFLRKTICMRWREEQWEEKAGGRGKEPKSRLEKACIRDYPCVLNAMKFAICDSLRRSSKIKAIFSFLARSHHGWLARLTR